MFEDILDSIKSDENVVLSNRQKTILYVIKTLNELTDMGILEGKAFELSDDALPFIEGFEPTDEEIVEVINFMREEGYIG